MKINWSKVNKQLIKDMAIWGYYNGFYYISEGHFMIKTLEIPDSTRNKLLSLFLKFPEDKRELMTCRDGKISELGKDFKDILDEYRPETIVHTTDLLIDYKNEKDKRELYKIFVYQDRYYYISYEFYGMVDMDKCLLQSNGVFNPLLITDDTTTTMIILPARIPGNEYLKELNLNEY